MRLFIGIRESGFHPMSLNRWADDPECLAFTRYRLPSLGYTVTFDRSID